MKAYFFGMNVKVMKQGMTLKSNKQTIKVPKDFIKECKIATRMNENLETEQINARDILHEVKKIKPYDAYCVCCITEKGLYPKDEWNFVYGLASIDEGVGVFSFHRYPW